MSEKRFIVENDNNEVSIKDKVEDNYPFALAYEHIDDADNLIQECLSLVGLLNEQQSTINRQSEQHKQILNELINENSELRMKIVSLENEIQRQKNELKNTRKEFIKKTEGINWLKSEDYLKKIY